MGIQDNVLKLSKQKLEHRLKICSQLTNKDKVKTYKLNPNQNPLILQV